MTFGAKKGLLNEIATNYLADSTTVLHNSLSNVRHLPF